MSSSDCTRERVRLWVYERKAEGGEPTLVETDLRLECSDSYETVYPYSKRLVALARSIHALLMLSYEEGWR